MTAGRILAVAAIAATIVGGAGYAMASGSGNTCSAATRSTAGYTTRCSVQVTVPASLLPTRTVTVTRRVTVTASPSSAPATSRPTSSSASPSAPVPSRSAGSWPASAFPSAANTGVPAGTTLTSYTGPCTITADNTVIDSKTVACDLVIHAKNVMIKNSRVASGHVVSLDMDLAGADGWSFTIQDSEIDAGTDGLAAVCCGNYHLLRDNIHGGQTAVQCDTDGAYRRGTTAYCDVRDSWLHGQLDGGAVGTRHLGALLSDGSQHLTAIHNTVACDHPVENGEGCTGDLNLIPHFAPVTYADIESNLFIANNTGSAFCTYGGSGNVEHSSGSHNIVYKNNTFQRGRGGSAANSCADYGPVTFFDTSAAGNAWSGNVWDDGSPVLPAG